MPVLERQTFNLASFAALDDYMTNLKQLIHEEGTYMGWVDILSYRAPLARASRL